MLLLWQLQQNAEIMFDLGHFISRDKLHVEQTQDDLVWFNTCNAEVCF